MDYQVSVVVPTRNRYEYLKYLIKLIDGFQLPELELVIQDNSDDNTEILRYLDNYKKTNISYYYSCEKLTMSQNGELAINRAKGEYICYIGDDDGVCRNIVNCVKWMRENNIKVAYNRNVFFTWGVGAKIHKYDRNGFVIHDSLSELNRMPSRGYLLSRTLPLIYHGIVQRDVVKEIQEKYKTLFPSVPPDISGAICLASIIDKYCELRIPVVINGISKMTGGGVISKGGIISLHEVSFITEKDVAEWEPSLPPLWVGNYAWANSAIKTLRHINRGDLIEKGNLEYCFAEAVATRPRRKILWIMGWRFSTKKIKFFILSIHSILRFYFVSCINNLPGRAVSHKNLQTIIDAENFFMQHLSDFKINKNIQ